MALEEYHRKRDFKRTPEPRGGSRRAGRPKAAVAEPLRFVIQKHAARRLHYDFRLELDGVLKSWAVPKGPSLDPGEKRLAVHVEDHPIEYGGFEGIIPEGQYGGGTVMLWDRGTWQAVEADAAAAYRKGTLKFTLDGEKLKGSWMLVRMGGRAAAEKHENWLLIKERDATALPGSADAVTRDNPASVASGRDMDAIANDADRVWDSRRGEVEGRPRRDASAIAGARRGALPERIAPQLATPVAAPPDGEDWLHEIKLDGYRILCRLAEGKVTLLSRNGLDWTHRFPELAAELARLPARRAILDGEAVHIEPNGRTSFPALQKALSDGRTADLAYYAFDLLHLDGYDLTGARLADRKAALHGLIGGAARGHLRFSDHQAGHGGEFYRQACGFALEGIVSKRADAPYRGERARSWLKVKCANQEEFIIIGFTDPAGSRVGFGALLVGYYDRAGALRYAGRVGTGFDEQRLAALRRRLGKLAGERPVARLPKGTPLRGVHWVRPELVAAIRYAEWTRDDILRHAVFLGLREDKGAAEVVIDRGKAGKAKATAPDDPAGEVAWDGSASVAGTKLSRAEKVLYPGEGITKLDLARYYEAVARWALPHLANRPLALVRCPEGSTGECFFQKHVSEGLPEAIRHIEIEEKDGRETALYVADAAGLVALVQIGVLEIHPWGARIDRVEQPDRLIFDLDPDEGLAWDSVVEAALAIRRALAALGLASFPKTTGGKGLHVVVPILPELDWEAAKAFTKAMADSLVAAEPRRYTAVLAKRARRGKLFIDYLRNGRGATAIGAFATRARPGAPVSVPLSWREVESGLRSDHFTIATVPNRLAHLAADPWDGFLDLRQSLPKAMTKSRRL